MLQAELWQYLASYRRIGDHANLTALPRPLPATLAQPPPCSREAKGVQCRAMASPRVSILLPARDAEATVDACLRSIARQSAKEFECLVVDDGSTDGTTSIVRMHSQRDRRFRLLELPRLGLVAALQHGLAACAAPLVARMDADDLMHRDRIALQQEAMARDPSLAGVGCHARAFPSRSFGCGTRAYMDWLRSIRGEDDVVRERFVESPLLHPTWMLRTAVAREHGYRDEPWAEDYDLLLRMLGKGERLSVVPRTLHGWRRGPACATATDPRYGEERRAELKAARLCEGPLASSARYVLWGHGSTGRRLRRALERLGRSPVAIVELDPRKIGQRHHGAEVIEPRGITRHEGVPILVCVANLAPRAAARRRVAALGKVELRDFWCCS